MSDPDKKWDNLPMNELIKTLQQIGLPAAEIERVKRYYGNDIDYYSDTDFSRAIDGRNSADIWPIMDELMSTVQALMPRLYDGVMRRLQG